MKLLGMELLSQTGKFGPQGAEAETYRRLGAERFAKTGLPTRQDEDWKYTSLKGLTETSFQPSFGSTALARETMHGISTSMIADVTNLVFVNGNLDRTLSDLESLPAGLEIGAPSVGSTEFMDALDALSAAYFGQGATLRIAAGARIEKPLCLRFHVTAQEGSALMVQPRIRVEVGAEASVRLIEWYTGDEGANYLTNSSLEVNVGARARVESVRFQDESFRATHLGRSSFVLKADANVFSLTAFQGSLLSRHELSVVLQESGAHMTTFGLASLAGTQQADQFSRIDHKVGACTTQQISKSLLAGASRSAFTGRIFIRPNAQKADSQQLSKSLLLSDKAESNSRPQLMIEADDVKASHGATVGHVSAEELFYLRSRGLSKDQSLRLLSFAFLSELLDPITDPQVKSWLRGSLERGFDRMVAEVR